MPRSQILNTLLNTWRIKSLLHQMLLNTNGCLLENVPINMNSCKLRSYWHIFDPFGNDARIFRQFLDIHRHLKKNVTDITLLVTPCHFNTLLAISHTYFLIKSLVHRNVYLYHNYSWLKRFDQSNATGMKLFFSGPTCTCVS